VVALYRYPVKAMAAEPLESAEVGWNGIVGDRRWAFVREGLERNGFPWLTIRQVPQMALYKSRLADPGLPEKSETVVATPSGYEMDVLDPALAAELGHGARVIRQDRGVFDTMPLSLISTQTLAALEESVGFVLEARRFRPNIVVDCPGSSRFPEDDWVGMTVRLGAMRMRIDKRDKRCMVTNVDPDTGERNPAVLRAITEVRQQYLGVYGSTVDPGLVSIGDQVVLQDV
jgi:uncharacterized protein YcbX